METFGTIMAFIAIISVFIIIGFGIVLIVGIGTRKSSLKRTGKLGLVVGGTIFAVSCISVYGANFEIKKQHAEANREFQYYGSKFNKLYASTGNIAENVGNNEYNYWGDQIDKADDPSDFSVDKVITAAAERNYNSINKLKSNISDLEGFLVLLKANNTGELNYSQYKDAYYKMKNMVELVSSPNGSYNSFGSSFEKYDKQISESYNKIDK
jgi:hypothetical protein